MWVILAVPKGCAGANTPVEQLRVGARNMATAIRRRKRTAEEQRKRGGWSFRTATAAAERTSPEPFTNRIGGLIQRAAFFALFFLKQGKLLYR